MNGSDDALARRRFMILNLARLGGLALVMLGIAVARGKLGLPEPIGWALAIAGLFGFFFLPPMLTKRWRN